jgi:hypothetical protein
MKRNLGISASFILTGLVLIVFAAVTIGADDQSAPFNADGSNLSPAALAAFDAFPVVGLGKEFQGQPLTALLRRTGSTDPTHDRASWNFVSHIYGDCKASADTGCQPPYEVQTWTACLRNESLYRDDVVKDTRQTLFGDAPVLEFPDGHVEVYSGTVTVAIFAPSADLALKAAESLVPANDKADSLFTGTGMVAPAPGAVDGQLTCSAG